jgi:replicative DNA helicase
MNQLTDIYDIENVIIGAILCDRNCHDIVFSELITEDFAKPENAQIYNSCLRLYTSSLSVDMVTVIEDMKRNNEPEPLNHILHVTNLVTSTVNIKTHVYYQKNRAIKKRLAEIGYNLTVDALKNEIDGITQILNLNTATATLLSRMTNKKVITFSEAVIDTIDEAINNKGKEIGIPTGFDKLDRIMNGLCAPDFTIIAAGPGEGKSTAGLNIAKNVSLAGNEVLFFSLEMKEKQLIWKLLSDELSKSVYDIRTGNFAPDHAMRTKLVQAKLTIYDKAGITIDEVCGIVKTLKREKDIKVVIIDYLQLLKAGTQSRKMANFHEELTIISNKIKELCMECDLPIIALSQLNRDKSRRFYTKSDLRGSGSLEQDADNILFIFRPTEHDMTTYEIGTDSIPCDENTAIFNLDKCRLGKTGEFVMAFKGEYSRFENLYSYEERQSMQTENRMPKADLNEDLPF